MSKTIKLQNASGKTLHKMTEIEIREMVIKQADAMLDRIPKEIRVAEVNAVRLESSLKEVANTGVWAQWERACCNRRNQIDGFTDPESPELGITNSAIEEAVFQNHFDSSFSIKQVTEQKSLDSIKNRAKDSES